MIIMREVPLHRILSYVHLGSMTVSAIMRVGLAVPLLEDSDAYMRGLQRVIGNLDGENIRHLEYISPKTPFDL